MDVARPQGFKGQGFSLKGDKNRFVLPTVFRQPVKDASRGAKTICLDKHDRWNCLIGFGTSRVDGFEALLDRDQAIYGKDFDRDMRAQQLYGCEETPFDDSGRMVIPEHLLGLVGASDQLFFRGAGEFILIWSQVELGRMGAGWESAQAACATFAAAAAQKGGKA